MFFHARAPELDAIGRVVDFSVLKERLGSWVDKNWDHSFLVNEEDSVLMAAIPPVMKNKDAFICPFNPTAENMAEYVLKVVAPKVMEGTGVEVFKIVLWETENCFATAEL
jgi:6-pyruvoyltetrahydropterin/6-carboxytetrahydropterin synthase